MRSQYINSSSYPFLQFFPFYFQHSFCLIKILQDWLLTNLKQIWNWALGFFPTHGAHTLFINQKGKGRLKHQVKWPMCTKRRKSDWTGQVQETHSAQHGCHLCPARFYLTLSQNSQGPIIHSVSPMTLNHQLQRLIPSVNVLIAADGLMKNVYCVTATLTGDHCVHHGEPFNWEKLAFFLSLNTSRYIKCSNLHWNDAGATWLRDNKLKSSLYTYI